ncbi:MAG TPA: glycosyltransferase [Thermoanaerobaculia bacterium]|nr:glycosyltransferase [Thermoanaerobaculia bacterium]
MIVLEPTPARGLTGGEDCGDPPPSGPRVSVVIPAYRSHATIAGCLAALRQQEYRSFEVVVVDSSPDERTAREVRALPGGPADPPAALDLGCQALVRGNSRRGI